MDKVFITEEEKTQLSNFRSAEENLVVSLGQIEYQIQLLNLRKDNIKTQIVELGKEQEALGKQFTAKYGDGNIDLDTGEFIKS